MPLLSTLKQSVQSLLPAYFALIMATGIVSVGAHLAGLEFVSVTLFWVNRIAYLLLLVLLVLRLVFFFPTVLSDLTSPAKGPGFFTIVAGSCVLGVQYKLLTHDDQPALILWVFGLCVWVVLQYAFFVSMIIRVPKPTLKNGPDGGWLLVVVSTQAVAVLGTLLAAQLPYSPTLVLFGTLCAFLLGTVFYLILVTLIWYRLLFLPVEAKDILPSYWINMGAVAITTLSGAILIDTIQTTTDAGLTDFLSFIKGVSLLAWATGTWWIPLLLLLEGWRHGYKKMPLRYDPQYWSFVFPLGMYMVATWRLSDVLHLPFLRPIAEVFIYLALVAWVILFAAMGVHLVKSLRRQPA